MALLEVRDIKKKFRRNKSTIAAVNGVSFSVGEGECFGLVGESGCGKSTTVSIIARLIREDSGEIIFDGKNITKGALRPVGRRLQMVFQNPADSFDPRDTVLRGVMQGAKSFGIYGEDELRERALAAFEFVGLPSEYADARLSELSGGECQRAAIARAILPEPGLLICDEATSSLDVLIQAQITELLRRLKTEKNMAMLFITHDLPLASSICDNIAVMSSGKIAETGTPEEIIKAPRSAETKKLVNSVIGFL